MSKTGVFCLIFLLVFVSHFNAQNSEIKTVKNITIEAPQLKTAKQIWVYLPKNYENSKNAYPVIYMHDAQNLFDANTSYAGEWHIDEFLDTFNGPKSIIVGIEHGNAKRLDELTPFSNETYGGGNGDAYLTFIVETLKPHIDREFKTLQDVKHTGILGSSLGGLMSLYAILKYPDVFGFAGVFSPSLWFSEDIFEFTRKSKIPKHSRFYFVIGTEESETAVPYQQKMVHLLLDKGVDKKQVVNKIVEGGQHNEGFWSEQFPDAYKWFINK